MHAARLHRTFAANVAGSLLCAREAVRRMSRRHGGKGGTIVNVSSTAASGAIDTITGSLAKEVATEGIRVNAVRPSVIYTEIHASGGLPNRVERGRSMLPMWRGGEAEVARAVLWLMSEEASTTTGAFIDVAGGG